MTCNSITTADIDSTQSELFPFVLPYDDGSSGITHMGNNLNQGPIGNNSPLEISEEGHFTIDGKRIRFWGVNVTGASCFPDREDAEKVAQRMAKFGVNIVRFHHFDQQWDHRSLIDYSKGNSLNFDEENQDRMDYFIYQLRKNGIYINLNLLTARYFHSSDGLPDMLPLDWKQRHVLGFVHTPFRNLEKDYAQKLLTHVNPYTKLSYAKDPAVVIVEINNENSMLQQFYDGSFEIWPEPFSTELQQKWNQWLQKKYGSKSNLEVNWNAESQPLGKEMLINANLINNLQAWNLEQHQGAKASLRSMDDSEDPFFRITSEKAGKEDWHIQLNQGGITLDKNKLYRLSFELRSNDFSEITANIMMDYAPWHWIEGGRFKAEKEWQTYEILYFANQDWQNLRVNFSGLGLHTGSIDFRNISLRQGGSLNAIEIHENLDQGTVIINNPNKRYLAQREEDWYSFLRDLERNYWQDMYQFLSEDLKILGQPYGTQMSLSLPSLLEGFGFVDTHAYWQHPHFPGTAWDLNNWTVDTDSMVNTRANTLAGLSGMRVLGMPFTVSEYQHCMPNPHAQEGPLMVAAYGALQDWDAVYYFTYEAGARDNWDNDSFSGFFQNNNHPGIMANFAVAANLFRRGDIQAARNLVTANYTQEVEINMLQNQSSSWNIASASLLGLNPEIAFVSRFALDTSGNSSNQIPEIEDIYNLISDTGELIWNTDNPQAGYITINTDKTKGLIGYVADREWELGNIAITSGSMDMDWCTMILTAQNGSLENLKSGASILLVSTGRIENQNMGWTDHTRRSLGRYWGDGPVMVETIPAEITLPIPADRVEAWALDALGQRMSPLKIDKNNGHAIISISGDEGTLWFEIDVSSVK